MKVFSFLISLFSLSQVINGYLVQDVPKVSELLTQLVLLRTIKNISSESDRPRSSGIAPPLTRKSPSTTTNKPEISHAPQHEAEHLLVTDEELSIFLYNLFSYDYNPFEYYEMNFFKKTTEPFFSVKKEIFETPRNQHFLSMCRNYWFLRSSMKSNISETHLKGQSLLINSFLENNLTVLSTAMDFLASKGFLKNDINEYKNSLHKLWFEPNLIDKDYYVVGSSGFEVVFVTQSNKTPYNWINVAQLEEAKKLQLQNLKWNTVLETAHGFKVTLVGFDSMIFGSREISNVYLLVGTSPELEMAIYTVCFYVRPNSDCSVSFGKVNLTIHVSQNEYSGKRAIIGLTLNTIEQTE